LPQWRDWKTIPSRACSIHDCWKWREIRSVRYALNAASTLTGAASVLPSSPPLASFMALACMARASLLSDREKLFVRTLARYRDQPSEKQIVANRMAACSTVFGS
jgi:hypothetical protein